MASSTTPIDDARAADEVRYQRLLDGMAEGVVETTPSGDFITTNNSFAAMLGYDSSEDLMTHVANAVDLYADPLRRDVEFRRVLAEPGAMREVELRDKAGNSIWIRARATLQYSPSGEVISIQKICEDITASRSTNMQLSSIVDGSADAIIGTTTDGTVTSWNRAAERMFGFAADEIIGRSVALYSPPERAYEQVAMRDRLIAGGEVESHETVRCRKDGTLIEVVINASTAIDEAGNVVGLSVIAHDNTERRRVLLALQASQQRLADAQRTAHIGSFEFDVANRDLTWSDEYYRILGVDPKVKPTIGLFGSMVHPDDVAEVEAVWADAIQRGVAFDTEVRMIRADSAERCTRARGTAELADDGSVVAVSGTMMDDTERVEDERIRRAAEVRFEIGFEQSAIGAVISDLQGLPTRVNPAMCALLERSESELIGRRWTEFTHPDEVPLGQITLARANAGHDTYADERRYLRPDGSTVWASVHVTLVRDESSEPQYYFMQLQDITERKQMESELAHQALHDSLTGLPNRALLTDRLIHSLAGARRRGTQVGVMFLDLDQFKLVNDSLGHTAGDDLLRHVSERLIAAIRPGDTVARFGGDEFVIVADDVSPFETEEIAERVLKALSQPCMIGDREMNVSASLGIAIADDAATPESLLRDSDAAMYRAKDRGRGRVELFDDVLRSTAQLRMATGSALHRALEREEFIVHYQPIVDLSSGRMLGAEALLRWRHPERGLVSPDEFIPMAEQTGLIVPIGAWVLEQACLELAAWRTVNPALTVSVNVSVRQMLAPDIAAVVEDVLRRTDTPPGSLCLELTESLFMEDVEYFGVTLAGLKALGVQLAIDDFGTGYSSLGYLKRFTVDSVKVDRAFVTALGQSPDDAALVAAIIAMAAALSLDVTAEGVETRDQLDILRNMDCHRAQGFYFARPMTAAAITDLVADAQRWTVD